MSLQSQYVIGLYHDVNPTKNRFRHNIACLLRNYFSNLKKYYPPYVHFSTWKKKQLYIFFMNVLKCKLSIGIHFAMILFLSQFLHHRVLSLDI